MSAIIRSQKEEEIILDLLLTSFKKGTMYDFCQALEVECTQPTKYKVLNLLKKEEILEVEKFVKSNVGIYRLNKKKLYEFYINSNIGSKAKAVFVEFTVLPFIDDV